ncbi:MAG: LUD domain-containing protein [Syntrophobacteraceae bacterium]|nr:LUD domain-containing protein [Syntrophobacteraceae bacterium]
MSKAEVLERYIRMAQAAGTVVERVAKAELSVRLAALLGEEESSKMAALSASGWPEGLRESVEAVLASCGFEVTMARKDQSGYSWDRVRLGAASVGIVWCEKYLAETGSLVLTTGPGMGGLASLLPEISIVLSDADGCLEELAEYLHLAGAALPARMTLVTGPSRTGDIEATMTTGVHGPGKVVHFILDVD